MPIKRARKICVGSLTALGLFLLLVSAGVWIGFPRLYPHIVDNYLTLRRNSDGSLAKTAFLWAKPPMHGLMEFYFFNVTNQDAVAYEGAQPRLIEVGPYVVINKQEKRYVKFSEDGEEVFYQNYMTFIMSPEQSCKGCSFDDLITVNNPTQVGLVMDIIDPQYKIGPTGELIISIAILLLGQYPFITVRVGDMLFDGYNDALLSAAHSPIVTLVSGIVVGGDKSVIPIPFPAMKKFAYFYAYNNSHDEEYVIRTGKGDISQLGNIATWGGEHKLPDFYYNGDPYASRIIGSDTGTFSHPRLKKSDTLEMYQSFLCRSFDVSYGFEKTVRNIPGYTFVVNADQYDTTLAKNRGFRYRNQEGQNYYPDWPSCPSWNSSNCDRSRVIDCSLVENLCDDCCYKSYLNETGTYLVPPGMYPLVCYPGRMQKSPFNAMFSPPHFLFSPDVVVNSVYGLKPDDALHQPFYYTREPTSGMVTQVDYRLMVSFPVFASKIVTQNMHMPVTIIPMVWQGAHVTLYDDMYDTLWLGFVLVPKLMDALKFLFLALGLVAIGIGQLVLIRPQLFRRRVEPNPAARL